jgi:uncharacterized protein (DUF2126 family)/transglutaminase-like putative cysteine protease
MTIRVALNHQTHYHFDRAVNIGAHEIRLRPAAHSRTPILSYSLKVEPETHFLNWQQDPFGNWVARLVFPEKAKSLKITVDLVADMTVINPFDFFIADFAENFPFAYPDELKRELGPYLEKDSATPLLADWLSLTQREFLSKEMRTIDMLVGVNQRVKDDVGYVVRMEAGVQKPEETLALKLGSCRDSAWLLVQIFRHLGIAARFASGYLIQLKSDVKALDGPSGTEHDFTDLHAWTEVFIPGAGWIGLDPTSGLLAGEGHIPLACTAMPSSAAPVIGLTDVCETKFDFSMSVTRIHEDPRVTQPYTEDQWQAIFDLGVKVDAELVKQDVRLTMGGEPTFISIDDMDGPEWNYTALSDKKLELSGELLTRLQGHFSPGAMLHFGQGKWYPGEPKPRWALGCYWRTDGIALWKDLNLLVSSAESGQHTTADALKFIRELAQELGLDEHFVIPAYEDVTQIIDQEQRWPQNLDPLDSDLKNDDERRRLAKLIERGLGESAGYVLPLKALPPANKQRAAKAIVSAGFRSSPWPLRREHLYLIAGDSPLGLRLPLASLPWVAPEDKEAEHGRDPFDATQEAPDSKASVKKTKATTKDNFDPREIVHTALCAEVRDGVLCLFLPPVPLLEDFVTLLTAIENTATKLKFPIRLEGYAPPSDTRLKEFRITPDPGVIEVNIHPSSTWTQLVENTQTLYEEARLSRLGTDKFMLDGRHTGTGGGNHITLGAANPADSPCLRRPDVLISLITYWQHHPALSYLFSGLFIGPTSQAPRVDEARHDSLYELEIAFQQIAENIKPGVENQQPWLVDRLLRNFLVDLSGNTHRAEFCIDKLYSPDSATGRLGLVEFRGFEMPPHAQMSLVQILLLRTLVARFWKTPYSAPLIRWGTELHDRYMLPHFVAQDMRDVVLDLRRSGYAFEFEWFAPFFEFRFPRFGTVAYHGIELELRQAIEPWHVLGEEVAAGGTSRYVDSSVERMQIKVRHMNDNRHVITCNGRPLPLTATGTRGEYVAGVRYRAWCPPSALHPTIGVQAPLVFDLVDTWNGQSIGGCTYHVVHPGGRNYDTFPVNANEAEARRVARFWNHGHTPGKIQIKREGRNPDYPLTLDLRRAPEAMMEGICDAPSELVKQAQQGQQ